MRKKAIEGSERGNLRTDVGSKVAAEQRVKETGSVIIYCNLGGFIIRTPIERA